METTNQVGIINNMTTNDTDVVSLESAQAKLLATMWRSGGQCYCNLRTSTGLYDEVFRDAMRGLLEKELVYEIDNRKLSLSRFCSGLMHKFSNRFKRLYSSSDNPERVEAKGGATAKNRLKRQSVTIGSHEEMLKLFAVDRKKLRPLISKTQR